MAYATIAAMPVVWTGRGTEEVAVTTSLPTTPRQERSDEAVLLDRYAAGDDSAMDRLMAQYQDSAFWTARHLLRNDEMALDVVQDAFVRLLHAHEQFDDQRSTFRAWFLQIVRNKAIDHLRRARVRPNQELVEQVDQQELASRLERKELGERIRAVIDCLPEQYRELLIMREVEGVSPQEIATIVGCEYGTARWRIHHARKLFRQEWIQRYGEEV